MKFYELMNMTVPQDLSPYTVVEFGHLECGCCLILKMEAAGFSETLLCYQTTRLNIPEEDFSMRNLCIILLSEM